MKESYPLAWPDGWPRTRPQDRKPKGGWKLTANQYRKALEKQLKLMGVEEFSYVISSNVPLTDREQMTRGIEPMDVGVAVYFSRKVKRDFTWQDALDIHDPAPTMEQVDRAFKRLSLQYHPDRATGNVEMFHAVCRHVEHAKNWINRKTEQNFNQVIPCDNFEEVRLNMAAIVMALKAFQKLENCGISQLLEQTFKGLAMLGEGKAEYDHAAVASR